MGERMNNDPSHIPNIPVGVVRDVLLSGFHQWQGEDCWIVCVIEVNIVRGDCLTNSVIDDRLLV